MLGREDREKINDLLVNVFTDTNLSLEELWPEIDNEETREYFEDQCSRVREAIKNTINTMGRTITVYIEVESTNVDDAIEKVKNYLPKPTGDILSWEIDVEEAWDYDEKGDH